MFNSISLSFELPPKYWDLSTSRFDVKKFMHAENEGRYDGQKDEQKDEQKSFIPLADLAVSPHNTNSSHKTPMWDLPVMRTLDTSQIYQSGRGLDGF
jgi:hypothetical protein